MNIGHSAELKYALSTDCSQKNQPAFGSRCAPSDGASHRVARAIYFYVWSLEEAVGLLDRYDMRPKKRKDLVVNSITIVDDKGNPKIGMHASGKSGYAGISFYKGKGRERYQALHIYISDKGEHSVIEFWRGSFNISLSLGASEHGAGMSIFDADGKHLKAVGTFYSDPEMSGDKKPKKRKSKVGG